MNVYVNTGKNFSLINSRKFVAIRHISAIHKFKGNKICKSHKKLLPNTVNILITDRLCGLMVRVPGYRYRGPGSIPGVTRFSEKSWAWNQIHSAS
jgi:hypothetical protein